MNSISHPTGAKALSLPALGLSLALACPALAATSLSYDFNGETNGAFFTGGVTGWTQDNPNPTAFGQVFPIAYIGQKNLGAGSSLVGQLGTELANQADNSPTTVSGAFEFTGTDTISPQVTLNLGIIDNDADSFTGRDAFSVAVTAGASQTIAQINFTPTAGDVTTWDVSVGVNGDPVTATGAKVTAVAGYAFQFDFGPSATSILYGSATTGANVLVANLDSVSNYGITGIAMTHTPLAAAGTSLNYLVFDDIVASVPEPSTFALFLLGLPFLTARRRS
ncbi:PEP-CTERM sorting domain-containing protein [Verrucomicrobiaceae bacterium 227]